MNDFEDQLERGLRAAADRVTTRSTDVDLIMSAGTQRTKRRQARLALGGVLVAGVAVVGSVAVLTRDRSTDVSIAAEPESSTVESTVTDRPPAVSAEPAPAGNGSAVLVPSNLTWRSVEVDSSEALLVYSLWGTGLDGDSIYEVSTEPGRSNRYQPTVWRSDDGLAWQPGSAIPLTPRAVTAVDGAIYAVGTAPSEGRVAKSAGGDAAVAVSPDGGESWNTVSLPVDLVAIEDLPGVSSVMVNVLVADGPAGVVALVQPIAMPDLSGVPGYDPDYGSVVHDDGVGFYGPDDTATTVPCDPLQDVAIVEAPTTTTDTSGQTADTSSVTTAPSVDSTVSCGFSTETTRLTWAELGADADTVTYLHGRRLFAFSIAADGSATPLGSLAIDDAPGQFSANTLVATDSSYVLMASTYSETTSVGTLAYTSPDGVSWARSEIGVDDYVYGPVEWSGGLAGTAQQYDEFGTPTDIALVLTADGSTWSAVDLDPVLDGVPLDGSPWVSGVVGSDNGLSILVGFQTIEMPTAETPVMSSTVPDTAPSDPAVETTTVALPFSAPSYAVLHSADGVNWSYDVLDELREVASGAGLRQAGGQLIVTVQQPSSGGALPSQLALVGTPTS